jgi:hypothetical protein
MKNKVIRGIITLFTIVLTAKAGRIQNPNTLMTETWYDLDMSKVVANAQAAGISAEYWIRSDGVKMYGDMVIVAAHPSIPRYSFVETSLGTGIVLDRHTCQDEKLIDIATDWKE